MKDEPLVRRPKVGSLEYRFEHALGGWLYAAMLIVVCVLWGLAAYYLNLDVPHY